MVLKFPRCSDAKADPILLGLGSGFSFASPLVPIFPGLENSLTLDFSGFFSGIGGAGGGCDTWVCEGRLGEEGPDRGNTTFAAA